MHQPLSPAAAAAAVLSQMNKKPPVSPTNSHPPSTSGSLAPSMATGGGGGGGGGGPHLQPDTDNSGSADAKNVRVRTTFSTALSLFFRIYAPHGVVAFLRL